MGAPLQKKNQVESLLPIPNGALYLNSISCPTTTFRQPQTAARPTTTPPPHNEAFLFVQCSLSPTSTLKGYTTTMSSTNLHNTKNDLPDSALLALVFLCYCSNCRMNKAASHAQLNYSF